MATRLGPHKLLCNQLHLIFNHLNKGIFNGKLEVPSFLIQLEKKVVFRFACDLAVGDDRVSHHHLIIGSRIVQLTSDEILEELLHEMVHMSNYSQGIIDTTANSYHNRHFMNSALAAGFYVARHKTRGWSITSLNEMEECRKPNFEELNQRKLVFESLTFNQEEVKDGLTAINFALQARGERKACFLKYQCKCPPPHNSIRSGRRPDGPHPVQILCLNCNEKFVCVEGK